MKSIKEKLLVLLGCFVLSGQVPVYGLTMNNYKCLGAPRVSVGCPVSGLCGGSCTTIIYSRTAYTCYYTPDPSSRCDPEATSHPGETGPTVKIYSKSCHFEGVYTHYCLCPAPSEGDVPDEEGWLAGECTYTA